MIPLGTHTAAFRGSVNNLPNRFVDIYSGTTIIDVNEASGLLEFRFAVASRHNLHLLDIRVAIVVVAIIIGRVAVAISDRTLLDELVVQMAVQISMQRKEVSELALAERLPKIETRAGGRWQTALLKTAPKHEGDR